MKPPIGNVATCPFLEVAKYARSAISRKGLSPGAPLKREEEEEEEEEGV